MLFRSPNLDCFEGEALALHCDGRSVCGVTASNHQDFKTRSVVITTGTFLNGLIHRGEEREEAGRVGDPPSSRVP